MDVIVARAGFFSLQDPKEFFVLDLFILSHSERKRIKKERASLQKIPI